ncbi:MAG: hypothetical protein K9N23_14280 [Akkermansiaceae bacterium]|nr:hypothetical protein [Akkermansiaceae bacterium]
MPQPRQRHFEPIRFLSDFPWQRGREDYFRGVRRKPMHCKHLIAILLMAETTVFAADVVTIAGVEQRPWIINDGGTLKSETQLMIDNPVGRAFDAWFLGSGAIDRHARLGCLARRFQGSARSRRGLSA